MHTCKNKYIWYNIIKYYTFFCEIFMLERINYPEDLKKLNIDELKILADDVRKEIIETTLKNGGHLASNLGTVELTIALHYVFNMPEDKIVFDVGHQAYTHKLLTGRKDSFCNLRQKDGISGFPSHNESEYDIFDAGHSSTSISAALGLARARDLRNEKYKVVAVIGDGAIGGGMALEALNDAGSEPKTDLIIILNDNEMSISKNVGALSANFTKLRSAKKYIAGKNRFKKFLDKINKSGKISGFFAHMRNTLRYLLIGENIFDAMDITYLGPIDGHSVKDLIDIFSRAKDHKGPVIIHTKTLKGKGYVDAENNPEIFHGVSAQCKKRNISAGFNKVLGESLCALREMDSSICAVTAGMTYNTGLLEFSQRFKENFYDTGIAEQHAIAMAGGLAKGGLKPVVVIYSTFLQRGFDQIFHDICLQNVPVTICVDHAGLTGEDGPTHQGIYDLGFLRAMPNLIILEPRDTEEFKRMLEYSVKSGKPTAIRYPKGAAEEIKGNKPFEDLSWEYILNNDNGAVISFGASMGVAKKVAEELKMSLIDARVLKPLDGRILREIKDKKLCVIEDNAKEGGLCEGILSFYSSLGISVDVFGFSLKDEFVKVGTIKEQFVDNCIDADFIINSLKNEIR